MNDPVAFHRDLAAGIALFNQRRYFDAHEVWEDRWRLESGVPRQLLHGLIQLAAAFHQLTVLQSPVGFERLLAKAFPTLRAVGPLCCGVAVGPLLDSAEDCRGRVAAGQEVEVSETLPRVSYHPPG